ncbi:MAG: hypothetical protein Kow0010_27310 [Dehalococcoidia bacterium]
MSGITVRQATPDDADAAAAALRAAFAGEAQAYPAAASMTAAAFAILLQTGHAFLVAERDGAIAGVARCWDDEGIAWFDLLAATAAGAGRALARAIETGAQDRGIRLVRTKVAAGSRAEAFFTFRGYFAIGEATEEAAGKPVRFRTLERRLPLLTVREQRREDAGEIARITGEDSYAFELGARPGWFVLADGDRVVSVAAVRDLGEARAQVVLWPLPERYRDRGLEAFMVERAAAHAETHGFAVAEVRLADLPDPVAKLLEDRGWHRDGPAPSARLVKQFREISRDPGESV